MIKTLVLLLTMSLAATVANSTVVARGGGGSTPPVGDELSYTDWTGTSTDWDQVSANTADYGTQYKATATYNYSTSINKTAISNQALYTEITGQFNNTGRIAIAVRASGTGGTGTGYYITGEDTALVIRSCNSQAFNSSCTFEKQLLYTFTQDALQTLRVEIDGESITVTMEGQTLTDTLDKGFTGNAVGLGVYQGNSLTANFISSFKAGAL